MGHVVNKQRQKIGMPPISSERNGRIQETAKSYRITLEEKDSVPRLLLGGRLRSPTPISRHQVGSHIVSIVREFGRHPTSEEKKDMQMMHVNHQRKNMGLPPSPHTDYDTYIQEATQAATGIDRANQPDLAKQPGHDPQ